MFLLLPMFCCYFFLIYLFVTAKAALPKKSLVFAARQITNNLSSIAKIVTSCFGLLQNIIRKNVMPSSAFYAYFVHVLRCSKQVIQTET